MQKLASRIGLALLIFTSVALVNASAQDTLRHGIVPLPKPRAGQWFERVWGDPDAVGKAFVARIHADRGYIVLPHSHPIDENIVILQGEWAFAMGARYVPSELAVINVGGFAFGPKDMPHFAWSKTDSTIQVHGVGPFSSKLVDPAYDLTDTGVFLLTYLLRPGTPTDSAPADCFAWKLGTRVRGENAKGRIIGARCSPANRLTQYWVRRDDGEQYWALFQDLKLDK